METNQVSTDKWTDKRKCGIGMYEYPPTEEYNSIIKGYGIGHDRAHTHTCIKKKELCHLKQ